MLAFTELGADRWLGMRCEWEEGLRLDAGLSVSGGWTSLVIGIAHARSGWVPSFVDTIAETVRIGAPQ